ncbi:ATP-dependent RNA helicase SrmB [Alginatibacterium sediminis]|uniref:ATP-dependent RNA helicase SrmB n=1 Tax=Alginatibacterium sediminis TaxID=2164068 RepID=A0A420E8J6_9ALTE|nr:ATP-dependent RNA helicase SrmB [Alginatibacterium sediminis]RKF15658.1 ATP-dependent RNA helicase SrmB [Alginatibacterium sediminis]
MTFNELDLDERLLQALEAMQLTKPTMIQQACVPAMLDGKDVMASAPTGTGKTLAFLLPALQHLLDFPRRQAGPGRILILCPTRELTQQIADQARKLAQFTSLSILDVTGGVSYEHHAEQLKGNIDIVVATPGRLMEYLKYKVFDTQAIEILVLDEADRMLDMGFISEMRTISDAASARKQTALLSATLEGDGLQRFAEDVMENPEQIEVDPPLRERGKINQYIHYCDTPKHKLDILAHYLSNEEIERCVVFVKTRERLYALVESLQSRDITCSYLRGEMDQDKRNEALQGFRDGKVKILVATDVAARGLDVPEVSHVFNFDLPRSPDVYVHRIGRTARGGRKGFAISLVEAHDMGILAKIQRYTENTLKARVVKGLEPQHRVAKLPSKKKKPATTVDRRSAKKVAKGKAKKAAKKKNK